MSNNSSSPSKFARFLRNNIAIILIVFCALAIGTVILVASLTGNTPLPPDDNKPVDNNPEDPNKPVDNEPKYETIKVYFAAPIANAAVGMNFTGNTDDNMFIRSSTLERWVKHYALDLIADAGTAVNAMYDGTVIEVSSSYGYGNAVKVDHGNGIIATYASLEEVEVVVGQEIVKGEKLGVTSISAMYEFLDGAHLHLEVEVDGKKADPAPYVNGDVFFEIEQLVENN